MHEHVDALNQILRIVQRMVTIWSTYIHIMKNSKRFKNVGMMSISRSISHTFTIMIGFRFSCNTLKQGIVATEVTTWKLPCD